MRIHASFELIFERARNDEPERDDATDEYPPRVDVKGSSSLERTGSEDFDAVRSVRLGFQPNGSTS